jgi:hypothetical protein
LKKLFYIAFRLIFLLKMDNSSNIIDSSTEQNQNSSQISSDESFSSRQSSTLSFEQIENTNQQKKAPYQGVDWDDVRRKLAVPQSPVFLAPDASQRVNMLWGETMNRHNTMTRNNGAYQMGRDRFEVQGLDLQDADFFENTDTCSLRDQLSMDLLRLYERHSYEHQLLRNKMPGTARRPHQDMNTWKKLANSYKNKNMTHRPERIWAEGDYLFSDDLTKKPKYRLLLNPAMRQKLWEEFPRYAHDLEITIQMKFLSLGFHVKVTAYTRLDKHRTSDKTFTVTFQSSTDARLALELIEQRRLDFRMNEARPSPRYHVKFIVLCRLSVYEGKCFGRRVRELQKGDIVTANQERGNKLRIIRYCPRGSKVQHELKGWVLLQTKEKELLRRIELVDGGIVMKERRFSFIKKPAPEDISAKCVPFRALNQILVYDGNKEPSNTVIDQLSPGAIVYADEWQGSMLRIIKTDACGIIELGQNSQPRPYGWVMFRRIEDGQPQFEFVPRFCKNSQRTGDHGKRMNQVNLMHEVQHDRENYDEVERRIFFNMAEELRRRKPSSSYNEGMSMVSSGDASNSVSPMRTVHRGASCERRISGSMRSESHSPLTTSSNEPTRLNLREKQVDRL